MAMIDDFPIEDMDLSGQSVPMPPHRHRWLTGGERFEWAEGYPARLKPEVAGERIRELTVQHGGTLTAEIVVEDARATSSPLHDAFEWDNRQAAHEYRLEQARALIRCLRVVVEPVGDLPSARRLMVHVRRTEVREEVSAELEDRPARSDSVYVQADAALEEPKTREYMVQQCLSEIRAWRRKWTELVEVSPLFEAVDRYFRSQSRGTRTHLSTEENSRARRKAG